jgi:outer membrane protein OmpA-like peptidoglycan-associated protein
MLRETVKKTVLFGLLATVLVAVPAVALDLGIYVDLGATLFTSTADDGSTVTSLGVHGGGGVEFANHVSVGLEAGYTPNGSQATVAEAGGSWGYTIPILAKAMYTVPLDTITFRPALFGGVSYQWSQVYTQTDNFNILAEDDGSGAVKGTLGVGIDVVFNLPGDALSLYAGANAVLVPTLTPEIRAGVVIKPNRNGESAQAKKLQNQLEELRAENERLQLNGTGGNSRPAPSYAPANGAPTSPPQQPQPPQVPYIPASSPLLPSSGPAFVPSGTTQNGQPSAILRTGLLVSRPGVVASNVTGPNDLVSAASIQNGTSRVGYTTVTQPAIQAPIPPTIITNDSYAQTARTLPIAGSTAGDVRVVGGTANRGTTAARPAVTGTSGSTATAAASGGRQTGTATAAPANAQLVGLSGATPANGTVFAGLVRTVYFNPDTARMLAPSQKVLNQLGEQLKSNQNMKITVRGYCAPIGNEAGRTALSKERAAAVANVLQRSFGVDEQQITLEWYGSEKRPTSSQDWDIASFRAVELIFG